MSLSYAELRRLLQDEPELVGIVLGGSRGKRALVSPGSDHDVYLIVSANQAAWRERFPFRHGDAVETIVMSLDEFRTHAEPGTETYWNRYTFAHVEPELDHTGGELTRLVVEKGRLPAEVVDATVVASLDDYINFYYRSAKNHERGLRDAARLDAAESLPPLLTALFALERRVRPYNKWLAWELEHHPLATAPPELFPRCLAILETGDLAAQQSLFRDAERIGRERGYGDVFDGWRPDVPWLRGA